VPFFDGASSFEASTPLPATNSPMEQVEIMETPTHASRTRRATGSFYNLRDRINGLIEQQQSTEQLVSAQSTLISPRFSNLTPESSTAVTMALAGIIPSLQSTVLAASNVLTNISRNVTIDLPKAISTMQTNLYAQLSAESNARVAATNNIAMNVLALSYAVYQV
jgi:hypothetical protein